MKIYPGSPDRSRPEKRINAKSDKPIKLKKNKKKSHSFFMRMLIKMVYAGFMVGVWGGIIATLVVLWFAQDLPDIGALSVQTRNPSVTVQTYDGTVLGSYGDLYEDMLLVSDLPTYVPEALMAVEDRRFRYHFGIDVIGLVRAAYANYKAQRVVQGGSTLTQQLAKNILQTHGSFTVQDRSMKRKIQEVMISLWLEWKFTKDQIMTMYLNRVYFGAGTYGIDAAARTYFNKSARNLTIFEAAVIAGLLQAPSRYSPAKHPKNAVKRATTVLQLMKEAGYITEYESHLRQGEIDLTNIQMAQGQGGRYFADWIYEILPSVIGPITKDLIVVTTLDLNMQRHAEMVTKHYNVTMGKELNASQIAFVAMAPDGAVRALVGGRKYSESQFNRATQAYRQSGSTFKTFVYLSAMEAGMSPDTLMDDTPYHEAKWSPSNFKYISQGETTLRNAFSKSVNSISIRLTKQLTTQTVANTAYRLGLTRPLHEGLSMALGAGETTLIEMTSAHATFANKGYAVWPYGVIEVRDKEGNILYQRGEGVQKKIINDSALAKMRDLLRAVVESGGGRAANIDSTIGGKTGSNGDVDAWFFCYRDDYGTLKEGFANVVVGVWVGNDSNAPMRKASLGGRIPAHVAKTFLLGPNTNFSKIAASSIPTLIATPTVVTGAKPSALPAVVPSASASAKASEKATSTNSAKVQSIDELFDEEDLASLPQKSEERSIDELFGDIE